MNTLPSTVRFDWGTIKAVNALELPFAVNTIELKNSFETLNAIKKGLIQGFDSIGIALCYGITQRLSETSNPSFSEFIEIAGSTELNDNGSMKRALKFVLEIQKTISKEKNLGVKRKNAAIKTEQLAKKSIEKCEKIGENGFKELNQKNFENILVFGRGNWFSFIEKGTITSALIKAKQENSKINTFTAQGMPFGSGLVTGLELKTIGIPFQIVSDNGTGKLLREGLIDSVFINSISIALNGDCLTDIGSYQLAVLAKENSVPVYVFGFSDTIEKKQRDYKKKILGSQKKINSIKVFEEAKPKILPVFPDFFPQKNSLIEVLPKNYCHALVSEKGVFRLKHRNVKGLTSNE